MEMKVLKAEIKQVVAAQAEHLTGLSTVPVTELHCRQQRRFAYLGSNEFTLEAGTYLLLANEWLPDQKLVDGAAAPVGLDLGVNPLNKAYITGAGSNPVRTLHHQVSFRRDTPAGAIGEPQCSRHRRRRMLQAMFDANVPFAKRYADHPDSWAPTSRSLRQCRFCGSGGLVHPRVVILLRMFGGILMKVAVIGGGSTYTPELINGFLERVGSFPLTELWLMDISQERLDIVGRFAQRMVQAKGAPFAVHLTTDQRQAITGASYVTTQLRVGGMGARRADEYLGRRRLIGQKPPGWVAWPRCALSPLSSIWDVPTGSGGVVGQLPTPPGWSRKLSRYAPECRRGRVQCALP
jgi:hypothetical protein